MCVQFLKLNIWQQSLKRNNFLKKIHSDLWKCMEKNICNIFHMFICLILQFFLILFCYLFFTHLLYKINTCIYHNMYISYAKKNHSFLTTNFKQVNHDRLFECLFAIIDSISSHKRLNSPQLLRRRSPRAELSFLRRQEARQKRSVCNEYVLLLMQVEYSMLLQTRQLWRRTVVSLHDDSW